MAGGIPRVRGAIVFQQAQQKHNRTSKRDAEGRSAGGVCSLEILCRGVRPPLPDVSVCQEFDGRQVLRDGSRERETGLEARGARPCRNRLQSSRNGAAGG